GVTIPEGSRIAVLPAAANRDPERFDDPERLDLQRADVKLLSFGAGFHFCVGAALARMEVQEGVGRIVSRFDRLERFDERVDWTPSFLFRGPRTLPLHVS